MHADAPALEGREPRQCEIIQIDEAVKEVPRGIDLDCQPPLREIDLDFVCALLQATPDLGFVLVQQVVYELLARIARDLVGRVQQAQGRGRDDRLLHGYVSVAQGHVQVAVRTPVVTKWAGSEPRHPADMTGRERDLEAVRVHVRQSVHAIRPEVMVLSLLAVRDHRRGGGLKPLNGIPNRLVIKRVQLWVGAVACRNSLDQPKGPRNASDRFCWDCHQRDSFHWILGTTGPFRRYAGVDLTRFPSGRDCESILLPTLKPVCPTAVAAQDRSWSPRNFGASHSQRLDNFRTSQEYCGQGWALMRSRRSWRLCGNRLHEIVVRIPPLRPRRRFLFNAPISP